MIRMGVVGTGYWAEQVHLPVLHASATVQLVGVWGRNWGQTTQLAEASQCAPFRRFEDLIAAVDAVSFAVPPDIQAELAIAAAQAGKHMLLEKPLALSAASAEQVRVTVKESGVAAVVFFTRVFTEAIEQAIQDLAQQGPWQHCTARFHAGALRPGSPYAGSQWRQARGALWDLGPHLLSVLLPLLGPVTDVRAAQDHQGMLRLRLRHAPGGETEATATLLAEPTDHGEDYILRSAEMERRLDVPTAPRHEAYGAALSALLAMIAGNRRGEPRYGVRIASEMTAILDEAQRQLSGSGAHPR